MLRPLVLLMLLASSTADVRSQTHSPHAQSTTHDRQYWRDIARNRYAVPQGEEIFALAQELSGYRGSPDPELRDDLAYTILDVWLRHQNDWTNEQLVTLLDKWQSNLQTNIGETHTDSIFRRSFSALCLASLANRDLKKPFLTEEQYQKLLGNALKYLADERDVQGFDPVKGWIHSTAHTADLLTSLAQNRRLKQEDQSRILQATSERLSTAHQVYTYGEQDRLALTVTSIVSRQDFAAAIFHRWIINLNELDGNVWKRSPPDDNMLKTYQNNSYMLQALVARLYAQPRTPTISAALDEITAVLAKR